MLDNNLSPTSITELPITNFYWGGSIASQGLFELCEDSIEEAFEFLSSPSVHSVILYGFLADNGLNERLNRGKYFGHRNRTGYIDGIALIGHSTIFDVRTNEALFAFAAEARRATNPINLIMSSGEKAETFFNEYSKCLYSPRKRCVEHSFVTGFPFAVQSSERKIRQATAEDLEPVARVQAELAYIESGVNPLAIDPDGFRSRVLRRINKARTFVVTENGRLIFKADLMAATSEMAYLEGVYVAPEERGKGTGSSCLTQVCIELLNSSSSVCLLSNSEFVNAHKCFERAGLKRSEDIVTLFV